MKYCPVCFVEYPDDQTTCATDKSALRVIAGWKSGDMIRKYRIIEKLGEGGMGSVYKAEHVTFEEFRALKVMHPGIAADPKFVRRFLREAKTARRLRHPNTVVVEDIDQADDGSLFIAMEFIDGPPLSSALKAAGRFPVPRALSIARSLASALQAAHAEGIIHRDIKPPNILMARDKQGNDLPKLVDFGIVALQDATTTLTSQLLLTPTYAAPEQFQMSSDEIDGRADLYALGFVLYEMLTGRLPFAATNATQWMLAKITQPIPPPSTFLPELARIPGLDQCLLKLTASNRDDRHKDAAELIEAIDAIRIPVDDEPPTVPVPKPPAPAPPPVVPLTTAGTEPPPAPRAPVPPPPAAPEIPVPQPPPVAPAGAIAGPPTPPKPDLVPPTMDPEPPSLTWLSSQTDEPAKPNRRLLWAGGGAVALLVVTVVYLLPTPPPVSPPPESPDRPPTIVDPAKSSPPKLEPTRPEPTKHESAKHEPAKHEPAKHEPAKHEPTSTAPQRIHVGGNVQSAKLVKQPKPVYPPLAQQARIQGTVRFTATIGKDGAVETLSLISGHPLLVPAAQKAVKQWVYQPTLLNGEPAEVITQIDVHFTLTQ